MVQRYPWKHLGPPRQAKGMGGQMVYDSFFVPGKTTKQLGSVVAQAGKQLAVKFVTRTATERGADGELVKGVRVWRIQ